MSKLPADAGRSALRLSEVARHVVIPEGIVDTLWFDVEARCRDFGVQFDTWQDGLGQVMLGLREDGSFAATVGGITLSIPRQVAKTFIVMCVVVALCSMFPNLTVLWTAHHLRTSTNTFQKMRSFVLKRAVRGHLAAGSNQGTAIRDANGEQEIPFANGSRILFGSRKQGFGRGFDEVDIEVFDEAQILDAQALDDMVAATNQSRWSYGALLFYMGTPPKPADDGEVFANRRAEALELKGSSDFGEPVAAGDAVYVECSADPDADPDDRSQWLKANPSYPERTPLRSMLRLRKNLTSIESWLREGLGIWDQVRTAGVIPMDAWQDRADPDSKVDGPPTLGVEVGPDLAWASVSLAGQRSDGEWHVELVENRNGAAWLPGYLRELMDLNPGIQGVVADVGGPIKAMVTQRGQRYILDGPEIQVTPMRVAELAAACTRMLDGTVTGWLHHIDQPQLTAAAQAAGKRMIGDTGTWVFSRKSTTSDITPIQSATYALWGAQNQPKVKRPNAARGRAGGRAYVTRDRAGRSAG